MSRRKFDRFMVAVELSANPKIGRLTDAEFRCLVGGVWPLAAKANPRGFLLVGALPAEASDVAHQARCTTTLAVRTMTKLRQLGMIEKDEPTGWEWVHDWDDLNPNPRPSDAPTATRDRKRQQRKREKTIRLPPGSVCVFCGTDEKLTVDHIVPKVSGGTDDASNLQPACDPCNRMKGVHDAPPEAWLKDRKSRASHAQVTSPGHANVTRDPSRECTRALPEVEVEVEVEEENFNCSGGAMSETREPERQPLPTNFLKRI